MPSISYSDKETEVEYTLLFYGFLFFLLIKSTAVLRSNEICERGNQQHEKNVFVVMELFITVTFHKFFKAFQETY